MKNYGVHYKRLYYESPLGQQPKQGDFWILFLMDFVTKEVDEGKPVDIFYLDFANVFDEVPRQRLVKKMPANW